MRSGPEYRLGEVRDEDGNVCYVGISHGAVELAVFRFGPEKSGELARLLVRATWEAARDDARAAARCAADCGAQVHDKACQGAPGG